MNREPDNTGVRNIELLEELLGMDRERALEEIIRRHGSLVLGVARRILGEGPDAEDVFQATFITLIRNSRSIRREESLGNWLYGVALRTALAIRSDAARRKIQESRGADMSSRKAPPEDDPVLEVLPILDQELGQLPQELRQALVLIYFDGKTHAEGAKELGRPSGSFSYLLARGTELLRERLSRRGVGVTGTAIGVLLASQSSEAQVSSTLIASTLEAAHSAAAAGMSALLVGNSGSAAVKDGPKALQEAHIMGRIGMASKGSAIAATVWLLAVALFIGTAGGIFLAIRHAEVQASDAAHGSSGSVLSSDRSNPGPSLLSKAGTPGAGLPVLLAPEELKSRLRVLRDLLRTKKRVLLPLIRQMDELDEAPVTRDPELLSKKKAWEIERREVEESYVRLIAEGWKTLHSSVMAEPNTYIDFLRDFESNEVVLELLLFAEEDELLERKIRGSLFRAAGMSFLATSMDTSFSAEPELSAAERSLYEQLLLAGNPTLTAAVLDLGPLSLKALEPHWSDLFSETDPRAFSRALAALNQGIMFLRMNLDTDKEEILDADPSLRKQTERLGGAWQNTQDPSARTDILKYLKDIDTPRSRELYWQELDEFLQTVNRIPAAVLDRLPDVFGGDGNAKAIRPEDEDRYGWLLARAMRAHFNDSSDAFESLGMKVFALPLPKAARLMEDLAGDVPESYRKGIREVLARIGSGETRTAVLTGLWYDSGDERRR